MCAQPTFTPRGLPVLIGSVPMDDHGEALDMILSATAEIPLWPQLPSRPLERMLFQFSENIPCIREEEPDQPGGRIWFDTDQAGFEQEQLAFYEDYLAASEDIAAQAAARFDVSRERAQGLYLLAERLPGLDRAVAIKGQVTGSFTLLTGIKDAAGRAGYFDDTIRDMVVKAVAMKAARQTRLLGATGLPVLMFVDEPALAGLGSSAFISVSAEAIREDINEAAAAIHGAGGLAGVHVCANTDWPVLLGSDLDVLSFDAYGFFDRLAPWKDGVNAFLDRGGIIAWGIVPTSSREDIDREDAAGLAALWEEQADMLRPGERAALLERTLITPSCGTGSLPLASARRVLELCRHAAEILRSRYLA